MTVTLQEWDVGQAFSPLLHEESGWAKSGVGVHSGLEWWKVYWPALRNESQSRTTADNFTFTFKRNELTTTTMNRAGLNYV